MALDGPLLIMNLAPAISKREPQDATTSSAVPTKSCGPDDSRPVCEKPVSGSSTTLPIVLAVVIPLTVAMLIFIVLHRRHVRKLRSEDANDRHKSLDFGLGAVPLSGQKKGKQDKKTKAVPEMSLADTERTLGRNRGMSMDMDMSNPYLLPLELHESRESLHSMSRTINNGDDKYRPATNFIPHDGAVSREGSTSRLADDSSSYTASTRRGLADRENDPNQSLLRHAQRMSRSMPPTRRTSVTSASSAPISQDPEQANRFPRKVISTAPPNEGLAPNHSEQNRDSYRSDISKDGHAAGLRKSNDYLGAFIRSGGPAAVESKAREEPPQARPSPPPDETTVKFEQASTAHAPKISYNSEPLNFDFPSFEPSIPTIETEAPESHTQQTPQGSRTVDRETPPAEQYEQDFDYDVRRLTMGVRPLPPDDPTEDPEERATRIRSFYKEYFDEAKPGPVYSQKDYHTAPQRFYHDGPRYEESSSHIVNRGAQYAQPMARRAMTPPPRGASSSQGPGRIAASMSAGHFAQSGPRAHSSASVQAPPRKKLVPPAPLQILPTPHMLKDDSFIPTDFAPPSSFRERRAGTPDILKGGLRPYSPALPAHMPLASSFDDLAVMPSPHALRRSGTFTALDFAPPPRFRSSTDTRSDSGSIRSSRSGMSAAQLHSIRTGAYRVSRIPQELGGTRQELADTLRPQWDMRKP